MRWGAGGAYHRGHCQLGLSFVADSRSDRWEKSGLFTNRLLRFRAKRRGALAPPSCNLTGGEIVELE